MEQPTYTVIVREFLDTTDFGLGDVVLMIENPYNLAYTEYINDVGEAFFTVSQEDPKAAMLRDYVDRGCHLEIYRNGEKVWGGWLGETDETHEDVIVYGYDYMSGLYMLVTTWEDTYTDTAVSTIIDGYWTRVMTTLTFSKMGWMTKGTVETLTIGSDSGSGTLNIPLYKVFSKRILLAMQELCAYAISDTNNRVKFEITPAGVFNLYRDFNAGVVLSDARWQLGEGKIRSYRRMRLPVDRRTVLVGVGTSPNDINLRDAETNNTLMQQIGRLEEPIYLQWVRDATELDRVLKYRMKKANRVDTQLFLTFYPNVIVPARATGADYSIGDQVDPQIIRGITNSTEDKVIIGQQVVWNRNAENVRIILADTL